MKHNLLLAAGLLLCLASCRKPAVPKPYGYFRADLGENTYQLLDTAAYPWRCQYATQAIIVPRRAAEPGEEWFDICYPKMRARIHCSYHPVHGNLPKLSRDAEEFVYKHTAKASSIPEQEFLNPERQVYGLYYELRGNTASPLQFYLTDSTHHFLRGALYFECIPNEDSLSASIDFIRTDIHTLIETLEWKKM